MSIIEPALTIIAYGLFAYVFIAAVLNGRAQRGEGEDRW
jgi:hypothetical protein